MAISSKRSSSSSSNKMIISHRHLPEEIIEEILVRLPFKLIFRFQCVCKSWFNLIKNSRLICNHLIKSGVSFIALCFIYKPKQSDSWFLNVFLFDDDYEEETASKRLTRFRKGVRRWIDVLSDSRKLDAKYPLPVLNFELPFSCQHSSFRSPLELVGHCNGILCLTHPEFILLVNPLLKEVKTLPNPIKMPSLVGFGFDNMTMDFKVVRLFICNWIGGSHTDRQLEAEVYNLKTNVWRKLGVFPFGIFGGIECYAFFNGVIHWCVEMFAFRWRMLTFNMATELFQLMDFPQDWHCSDESPPIALSVLNQDSLVFVNYSTYFSSPFVGVWTMNKHATEETTWKRLYSIGPIPQLGKPISFWKKHKFLYETNSGRIVLYDPLNGRWSVVFDNSQVSQHNQKDCYSELCLKVEAGVLCGSSLVSMNI